MIPGIVAVQLLIVAGGGSEEPPAVMSVDAPLPTGFMLNTPEVEVQAISASGTMVDT